MVAFKTLFSVFALLVHADADALEAVALIQQRATQVVQLVEAKTKPKKAPATMIQTPEAQNDKKTTENKAAPKQKAAAKPSKQPVEVQKAVESNKNQLKEANAQMKELQQQKSKAVAALQKSMEKQLKDQDRQNQAFKKHNDATSNKIQKLKTDNIALREKAEQSYKKNMDSWKSLHERRSNLTAALAFTMSSEEKAFKQMNNFTLHTTPDELKDEEVETQHLFSKVKGVLSAIVHPLGFGAQKQSLLQHSAVGKEEDGDVVNQMAKLVLEMNKGQSDYESVLKEAFNKKFKEGDEIHQALVKEATELDAAKAIETELHFRLAEAVKHCNEARIKIDKNIANLKKFAQGTHGHPLQASLLGEYEDDMKLDKMTTLVEKSMEA